MNKIQKEKIEVKPEVKVYRDKTTGRQIPVIPQTKAILQQRFEKGELEIVLVG